MTATRGEASTASAPAATPSATARQQDGIMQTVESWSIAWPGGEARLRAVGGMLTDCSFVLPSGRRVTPFATCPWVGEDSAEMREQPGHMRWLGGEFTCLPFGVGSSEEHTSAP